MDLLHDPTLNKGTAFTEEERKRLKLRGLLPPRILTQEQQVQKVLENFRSEPSDIEKYLYLIFIPGQANNVYIFPGVALGVIISGARRVTDTMFLAAARTLAATVSDDDLAHGSIFPPLHRVREISRSIATAVADIAYETGLATEPKPGGVRSFIESRMYNPRYEDYV